MSSPAASKLLQVCAVDFTAFHFMLPLMRAQREWGFDVHLACAPGEYCERIEAEGFTFHPLRIERSRNILSHAKTYRALLRILRETRFEAVHLHTPIAALIGRFAARRAGVPVIVYTAHGFYFHDGMRAIARRLHVGLERWAQRRADFLLTQSGEDAETAVREGISTPERTLAIGNGIDVGRFRADVLDGAGKAALLEKVGIAQGERPVVTMMARLVREKGYFEFLDAWSAVSREFPRARALVIGGALESDHDDSAAAIHARADELGLLGSIVFAGMRRDVPELLAASDVFVLPSWREGMPRSIIEAMASGLPVVATDIRGCREEVIDGNTGFIVPVRDSDALAKSLARLVRDENLRRRMGAAGRKRAEAEFDEAVVIERQRSVFEKLFREKGSAWPREDASR